MSKTKRTILILMTLALVNLAAPSILSAGAPEPIVVDLQSEIGSGVGTFQASGAIEDEGTFMFTSAFIGGLPSQNVVSVHIRLEFTGSDGTFTAQLQTVLTLTPGCEWPDHGHWVILSGTGAYQGLRGTGVHHSIFNVCTGQAPAVWEGSVHAHG